MNKEITVSIIAMIPDGNRLNLPTEQLDNYPAVKKILLAAGGKYSKNGFTFPGDAAQIQSRLSAGEELNDKKKFQFFETPPTIAAHIVSLAKLKMDDRVLEPSAGRGNIGAQIGCPDLTMIDINPECIQALHDSFDDGVEIIEGDFLACDKKTIGTFDKIIMNPPFTKMQDIKHVKHALTLLNDQGILVAICGNGPRQHKQLEPLATHWEELPPGTFKKEGTNVSTAIFVIDKTIIVGD